MTRTMSTMTSTGTVPAIAYATVRGQQASVFARLWLVLSVWQERRALTRLDERALKDLGLSRADVDGEATRSLFDLPEQRI